MDAVVRAVDGHDELVELRLCKQRLDEQRERVAPSVAGGDHRHVWEHSRDCTIAPVTAPPMD